MGLRARVRALWLHRRTLWLLVRRDLKVRYAGSALGYLWTVLDPLLMTLVYFFVFSFVFTGRPGPQPYVLYIAFGQLAWHWFTGTVNDCSRALTSESRLVRSTRLPREIWVLKVVGSKGLEFLFSLPVVALFMLIYLEPPGWQVVLLPVAVLLEATLLTGIGLALAVTTVMVPDLQRLIRIVLRVTFYLSPVIYSVQRVPDRYHLRDLYALNPITGILDLFRSTVFAEALDDWRPVAASVVIALLVLVAGAWVFARLESTVLKEL